MSAAAARPAVLVVEDESLVRMFAVDVIEDEGYEVIEAASAAQALEKLRERPDISIIFTDINMPGDMDGLDLARAVLRTNPGIHIILTSGKQSPTRAELPGASPFVTKPYTAQQLARLLDRSLS
jgi:CheY-like chemotaxis protein